MTTKLSRVKKSFFIGSMGALGFALAVYTSYYNPTFANTDSTECQLISVGDVFRSENRNEEVIHKVPVSLYSNKGMGIVFIGSNYDGYSAFAAKRGRDRIWRSANDELPMLKITREGNKTIYDWTGTGAYGEDERVILFIQYGRNRRLNDTIIPVGLKKRSLRAITKYPSKLVQGKLYSPFMELTNGLAKGLPVSDQLNTILNEETAAGDILIPSVFQNEVKIENLQVVSDFPECN